LTLRQARFHEYGIIGRMSDVFSLRSRKRPWPLLISTQVLAESRLPWSRERERLVNVKQNNDEEKSRNKRVGVMRNTSRHGRFEPYLFSSRSLSSVISSNMNSLYLDLSLRPRERVFAVARGLWIKKKYTSRASELRFYRVLRGTRGAAMLLSRQRHFISEDRRCADLHQEQEAG